MPDLDIKCKDCGNTFQLSEGEQAWLSDRFGADYKPPKRCRTCRQQRKLDQGQSTQSQPAVPASSSRRRRDEADKF